jgi:hypothetical protein
MFLLNRFATPFALAFVLAATLASGADRREARAATGFTSVNLSAPVNVDVVQGDTEGLVLEGDDAALADLETVVEQGALKIRKISRKDIAAMSKVRVHVSAKAIEALRISGSGDITAARPSRSDAQDRGVGSGDVRIPDLDAGTLDVSVAGSGDVLVGGKADTLSTSIAGSGDVKVGKLAARTAKVSIAGSGDVILWASEQLSVNLVGSGDVRFYGDPEVKRNIVGSGSVRRLGATPS